MTEEEMKMLVDKINTYWTTPHPDAEDDNEVHTFEQIHDFDRVPDDFMREADAKERHLNWFQTKAHVDAVKAYYMARVKDDSVQPKTDK